MKETILYWRISGDFGFLLALVWWFQANNKFFSYFFGLHSTNQFLICFLAHGFRIQQNENWPNVLGKISVWWKDRGITKTALVSGSFGLHSTVLKPTLDVLLGTSQSQFLSQSYPFWLRWIPLRLEAFFKLLQLRSAKSVSISFRLEIISEVNYWGICNNPIIILAMLSWGMLEVLHLIKDPEKKRTRC